MSAPNFLNTLTCLAGSGAPHLLADVEDGLNHVLHNTVQAVQFSRSVSFIPSTIYGVRGARSMGTEWF